MRLQKYLADAGIGSRRACEVLITDGRVTVNGKTATLGMTVEPETDNVQLDGKPVLIEAKRRVILFYKPRGVVSTSDDPEGRKTVQDFFKDVPERLYNVGRLDVNSEGLLIMTNDGELAYLMTHPKFKVPKTYYAVCDGILTPDEAANLTRGVELSDGMTAPAKVERVRQTRTGSTCFSITIREGRNRQIRRMLEAVGHKTLLLRRERVGPLYLGNLAPGEWRDVTQQELLALHEALRKNGKRLD